MRIGIVCYASVGGSGIIATELAMSLAARGHDVHLISTDTARSKAFEEILARVAPKAPPR